MDRDKQLKSLLRHIDNVRANTIKLGEILKDKGEESLALNLIANGYCHDNSKFYGSEWLYLNDETKTSNLPLFQSALLTHVSHNKHHPEAWVGGVHSMDRLHRAEMVCDWASRSAEFGTDLRGYLKDVATKRFDMAVQSKAYKEIKDLIDMLLDPSFS